MATMQDAIIFGFDSAWTDNPRAPGAICAIRFDTAGQSTLLEPRLVSFSDALAFIEAERQGYAFSLVALDQPTIVPNARGSRPVDKVAASLISYIGGGVQPANRGKATMFGEDAPVWKFLSALAARQDPRVAQTEEAGHFLIEVFPALALPALGPSFARRLGAPKYNPANRGKFRLEDWRAVSSAVAKTASSLDLAGLAQWADQMQALEKPGKADQDRLDAAICALIGLLWREAGQPSAMLGDLETGYMITPLSGATRHRLEQAALDKQVDFLAPLQQKTLGNWRRTRAPYRPAPLYKDYSRRRSPDAGISATCMNAGMAENNGQRWGKPVCPAERSGRPVMMRSERASVPPTFRRCRECNPPPEAGNT
ncbi:DUF429 domain-containing protein [Acidimangrovimonas pyrenivorans]|uniref:DUF429 domain-containing protein n=1 Tax=Acidimangrovimonas pyrenivorans TaxID=2030798 RepID=A0ABV7AFC2_9RHOB